MMKILPVPRKVSNLWLAERQNISHKGFFCVVLLRKTEFLFDSSHIVWAEEHVQGVAASKETRNRTFWTLQQFDATIWFYVTQKYLHQIRRLEYQGGREGFQSIIFTMPRRLFWRRQFLKNLVCLLWLSVFIVDEYNPDTCTTNFEPSGWISDWKQET